MKIELKKIEYNARLSEETNAFSADLYIDGKKAGIASNRGHGGPTEYQGTSKEGDELIRKAEEYCKALPPHKYRSGDKEYSFDMDLELFIDNLLDTYLEQKELQKFRNKMEKSMEFSIVIGIPDKSFGTLSFKSPIDMILVHPRGPEILKDTIAGKVIPQLTEGKIVLNTNIPERILKEAGLKETQYVPPAGTAAEKDHTKEKRQGHLDIMAIHPQRMTNPLSSIKAAQYEQ